MRPDPDEPVGAERAELDGRIAEASRAKREAAANGDPRARVPLPAASTRGRRNDTAARVLATAHELAAEGRQPTPRAIGARIDLPRGVVSQAIARLRDARPSRWPYGITRPGLAPGELLRRDEDRALAEDGDDPIGRLVDALVRRVFRRAAELAERSNMKGESNERT